MSAAVALDGAWGGDPARKRASVAVARKALAAGPVVMCNPALLLDAAEPPRKPGNVFCAAYGTADPSELETRAGLPASTLMLASAALVACEHWVGAGDGDQRVPRLVNGAAAAPIALLEAIRVGADPLELTRHYVVDLLGELAAILSHDGRGLTREQQSLVRQLATLHSRGTADCHAFRALRRTATAATDAATGDLATTVLRFVEAVAWPLAGLVPELPAITARLHFELRTQLAPERRSPGTRATLEARLEGHDLAAAEAYAPFAVVLLIGAFQKA